MPVTCAPLQCFCPGAVFVNLDDDRMLQCSDVLFIPIVLVQSDIALVTCG